MAGNPLSKMFGSSPFTPIQQHMETSHAAASVLEQFFQAVLKQDWSEAAEHQKQIGKLENEADKMKKAIRLNLPKSLFLSANSHTFSQAFSVPCASYGPIEFT